MQPWTIWPDFHTFFHELAPHFVCFHHVRPYGNYARQEHDIVFHEAKLRAMALWISHSVQKWRTDTKWMVQASLAGGRMQLTLLQTRVLNPVKSQSIFDLNLAGLTRYTSSHRRLINYKKTIFRESVHYMLSACKLELSAKSRIWVKFHPAQYGVEKSTRRYWLSNHRLRKSLIHRMW